MSKPIKGRVTYLLSDSPEEQKFNRGHWDLASYQVSLNSVRWFRESRNCLNQSEAMVVILFSDSLQNTNLVKEVGKLLPVKFPWIPFSGFKGEFEDVLANQRPGGHLVFLIGRKTQTW